MQLRVSFQRTGLLLRPYLVATRLVVLVVAITACGGVDMRASAADKTESDLRSVNLYLLGGDKETPLADVDVEVTNGHGQQQKRFGPFKTDKAGMINVKLPPGFYSLDLKSEKELPWLPVEVLWNKKSRRPRPDLSFRITDSAVEKWLDGNRQDKGYNPPAKPGGAPNIKYVLLPACELVLRAVDAETGKGLAGAKFYTENALAEDWAHSIEGQNLGANVVQEGKQGDGNANATDSEGNFRRLVSANAGFKYGIEVAPPGYEPVKPNPEVEIDITYGLRRAEHVFKFSRIGQDRKK
jgi:hypothetical protein